MVASEDLRAVHTASRLAGLDEINDVASRMARDMMAGG
jgi:hypothetical protein